MPEQATAPAPAAPAPAAPVAKSEPISPKNAIAGMMKGLGSIDTPPAKPTVVDDSGPAPTVTPPATKPAPAKAEPAAEDFSKPDPSKPPTNSEKWKKWNEARDAEFKRRDDEAATLKKELDSVKQQIADNAKAKPADALSVAELETLKKERDELSAQLYSAARERHPEFRKKYDAKIEEQMMDIKMVAGEQADKITKLINLPESEWRTNNLKEAMAEIDELDRPAVRSAWLNIDKIRRQRDSELATSKEEFNRMVTDHEVKEKAQREKQAKEQRGVIDTMFDSTLESLTKGDKRITELTAKKGDEAWNSSLQDRLATAKAILLGEAKPEQVVRAVLRDAAFEPVEAERDSLRVENEKLLAQIESLKGASPKIVQPSSKTPPGMSIQTALTRDTTPQAALKSYVQSLRSDAE